MNDPVHPEEAIFEAAFALPASERAAYLDRTCGDNAGLRQLVEALLGAHEEAGEFLEGPAPGAEPSPVAGPQSPRAGSETTGSSIEKPGDRIGRYKLLQQIGEGGCGVVYMAEQEEPVRRKVALKVIKLGMDTKQVIARFEAERQALAVMDHPHIAKVFDAGATETGRPYFVMELVRGVRITQFCDERQLCLRERLDLFIQVCRAIQHAHQKGLIHRDIKPSNILVTLNDGVPVPKVIDFGIAKATEGRLTEQTLFTRFEQFLGTPAYVSPEQAEAGGVDIDTRSDIYSLGVVLYELLTGRTPFDSAALLKQGIEELILTLRDVEPPRPSTRLTTLAPADLETVARSQRCEAPKLVPSLRGDLDWIVMKCLEKDRTRRYDTANGLAMDVQRHLDDEPVVARPPSNRYRFQKLVRRNKLAFMALTIVAGLLILGLGAATVAGVRIARDSQRIRQANTLAIEKLWTSYLSEALARRTSNRGGQRFGSLETLQKAAKIRPSLEVRNEAIASLAVSDLRLAKQVRCKSRKQHICFDSKLERYALAESDGSITIRAAADDAVLASLPATGSSAVGIRFSPNDQFLMVSYSSAARWTLWVWNLAQLQAVLRELPGANGDFSPDSRFLARSNPDGALSIYELGSGAEIRRLPLGREFAEVALDSGNTRLACRSESDSTVEIVDAASGRTLRALVCASPASSLGWSPDGSLLATGCLDGRICIWNPATGAERAVLEGHTLPAISVQFNHAGNLLASSSSDDTLRLWNPDSRRQIVSWPGAGWNLQFSPDDGYLGAITEGSQVRLLQVTTSREFRRLFTGDLVYQASCSGLDFSADGCFLSVGVADRLQFWNASSGAEIGSLRPVGACLTHIFHPNGKVFITAERSGGVYLRPLKCSASASGTSYSLGRPRRIYQAEDLREMALSLDGRHLAVVANHDPGQSVILDLADPSSKVMLGVHPLADYIAVSPDARWAATGSWQNELVRVWNARSGELARELNMPSRTRVAFSPDGRWLGTSTSAYQVWEVGSWTARTLDVPTHPVPEYNFMAFSPDGKVIAALTEGRKIQLLETATGKPLATLEPPNSTLGWALSFSPDGTQLAVLERSRQLQLWDLRLIRERLKEMGLDWAMPPYPALEQSSGAGPITLDIDSGSPAPK